MVGWPQISVDSRDYSLCFGCGQNNPIGLKLIFQWDGKTARAEFTPTDFYQGWSGLVHGGIILSILDEAMGWAAVFEGLTCVTAEIQAKLRCPAAVNEPLIVTASLTRKTRKVSKARAVISLEDGKVVAEGTATQYVVNSQVEEDKSRE